MQRSKGGTGNEYRCDWPLAGEDGYLFEPKGFWGVGLIEERAWLDLLTEASKMARERVANVFPPVLE